MLEHEGFFTGDENVLTLSETYDQQTWYNHDGVLEHSKFTESMSTTAAVIRQGKQVACVLQKGSANASQTWLHAAHMLQSCLSPHV